MVCCCSSHAWCVGRVSYLGSRWPQHSVCLPVGTALSMLVKDAARSTQATVAMSARGQSKHLEVCASGSTDNGSIARQHWYRCCIQGCQQHAVCCHDCRRCIQATSGRMHPLGSGLNGTRCCGLLLRQSRGTPASCSLLCQTTPGPSTPSTVRTTQHTQHSQHTQNTQHSENHTAHPAQPAHSKHPAP
jgi:hypothetical protein